MKKKDVVRTFVIDLAEYKTADPGGKGAVVEATLTITKVMPLGGTDPRLAEPLLKDGKIKKEGLPQKDNDCILRDDDDSVNLLPVPLAPLQRYLRYLNVDGAAKFDKNKNVFAQVFVIPQFDGDGSPKNNNTVPFKLHVDTTVLKDYASYLRDSWDSRKSGSTILTTNQVHWISYMQLAFQPEDDHDLDPDTELFISGTSITAFGCGAVFLEVARDRAVLAKDGVVDDETSVTLAHELAHTLGIDHRTAGPQGIMLTGGARAVPLSAKDAVFTYAERVGTTAAPGMRRFDFRRRTGFKTLTGGD